LREAEQRANLLGSVREEIRQVGWRAPAREGPSRPRPSWLTRAPTLPPFRSAFKSSSNSSATDSLLGERSRIDSSHRMMDDTLE